MNLKLFYLIPVCLFLSDVSALPDRYDELLDYVQEAPDQGEAATCLFMGNTGAMEIIANFHAGIKNPVPYGPYDLAESYSMWGKSSGKATSFFDTAIHRFNGKGIHINHWPFEAWSDGGINYSVWDRHPKFSTLPRVELPEIETEKLFTVGNKWSTYVLRQDHIEVIKNALWKNRGPVIVNYNDTSFWHVVLIVGYDDHLPGTCHDTDPEECKGIGAFYVRDSFGVRVELRDYDWFRLKGNAAIAVRLKESQIEI